MIQLHLRKHKYGDMFGDRKLLSSEGGGKWNWECVRCGAVGNNAPSYLAKTQCFQCSRMIDESNVPDDVILAYTAAMLDGEGSIQINPSKPGKKSSFRYWGLTVQIAQNNRAFLGGLREEWGGIGNVISWQSKDPRKKLSSSWRIYSNQCEWFLKNIIQYLRIKKEHALVAIEFRKCVTDAKGVLTDEMKAKRRGLAFRMKELNDICGKASLVKWGNNEDVL